MTDRGTTAPAPTKHFLLVHRATLEVVEGPAIGRHVSVADGRVAVGRAPGNQLELLDPQVSAIHFELETVEEGFLLRDLGSRNGTFVGALRVREALLAGETQIRAGSSVLRLRPLQDFVSVTLSPLTRFGSVLGESAPMRRIFALLERAAPSELTVLLQGETGTGKEELARSIHACSPRAHGPFVVLDCGTITPSLAEASLFGHERGAFTGADRARPGPFEEAHGGTIFLDELGELPPSLQPKLLRVLENRTVVRVGDARVRPVEVRVIAATNRDLRVSVNRGRFRADLYHRLAGLEVTLPPLRDRSGDLALLTQHLLLQAALRSGTAPVRLADDAQVLLEQHAWPGNVRELRNLVHRLNALWPGQDVGAELLEAELGHDRTTRKGALEGTYREARARALQVFDAAYLTQLHERSDGNLSAAARQAGLARHTLRRLMRKAGIRNRES